MNKIINKNVEKSHEISLENIATAMQENKNQEVIEHQFDLLVEEDGKQFRLPYAQGREKNVVGIFPYAGSNVYLETDEQEETTRIGIDEENVPVVSVWRALHPILDALNSELSSLNLPIIEGAYFTRTLYRSEFNWIAKFFENHVDADMYSTDEVAKIRYVGTYEVVF